VVVATRLVRWPGAFRRRRAIPACDPPRPAETARERLLTLAREGLVLQLHGERVMAGIRDQGDLSELSRRGGPLISRFEAMRRELPETTDAEVRAHAETLSMIFANHAMQLDAALDLLSVNWRSQRMVEELSKLDGLGAPSEWLWDVEDELSGRAARRRAQLV
jgi:hypothetical protein